jgi:hypothetical protein
MGKRSVDAKGQGERLSNQEIVTVAVFLLGGGSKPIDTEDVAVKANELAPTRFTWRKYPDQINIETVRKRLWDARRPDKAGFLTGSERVGWSLTQKGLRFAKSLGSGLTKLNLSKDRLSLRERQWQTAERHRLLASEAFESLSRGGERAVKQREAEAFFRLDEYVVGDMRERKILRLVSTFSEDPQLGDAVRRLAAIVSGRVSR